MKISRLLLLGVLASSLCMVGSAFGQGCTSELSDSAFPNGVSYNLGDTINYELCIGVPASDGTTYCTLTNVDVYFYPPGQRPTGANACDDPGSDPNAVFIAHLDELAPGDSFCYDGTNNDALDYLIEEAPCAGDSTSVIAFMAVTFELGGEPDCDRKTIVNTVNPVDPPVCDISGPEVVCEGAEEVEYTTTAIADTYLWSVAGDAVIVGPADGTSVLVSPTSSAGFTVELEVCNDNGNGGCCDTCDLPVTVTEAPDCLITGPDSICEDATEVEFCSDAVADSYFWEVVSGDAVIVGSDIESCVRVSPGESAQFELRLSVCNEDPRCCDDCTKIVDVISIPDCTIEGPETLCEEEAGVVYCAPAGADSYSWSIEGNGAIVGPTDGECVTVDAGLAIDGGFTLTVLVCNESDLGDCCDECTLEVTIEECGQTYCSFTQGFYGNEGGKACDGRTTTELLEDLLGLGGDVVVGGAGRSIRLQTAACIITRLPAGGTPMALPSGLGEQTDLCDGPSNTALDAVLTKAKGKDKERSYNNVLIGQVVTLTLNVRLGLLPCLPGDDADLPLGLWQLPDTPFCTVPYDDPNACSQSYEIPEALQGMTVALLLEKANAALAGSTEYSISDIYTAVTAINEAFDECRTIVPCIRAEICGNGCDDDGDGLVDGDDPDCQI